MEEEKRTGAPDRRAPEPPARDEPRETATDPAPGVEHKPEPDAENIIPIKHEPGTL